MKNLLIITFLLLGMMLPIKASAASSRTPVPIIMQKTSGKGNKRDDSNTSKRIPPAPVYCTIDFANQTVDGGFTSALLAFEVWNEEGDECIAIFNDEISLVEYLDSTEGDYQLRFFSESYVYIGYISL